MVKGVGEGTGTNTEKTKKEQMKDKGECLSGDVGRHKKTKRGISEIRK
jgi:hypothetical protein